MRLLLATDAASEGINMQECCRWIIHYDIPWSPSKLQQRNGRVSRHGQVRDVSVHYFRCDQEEDMNFLFYVAQKVEQVRQDLGSVERIFDAAIQRHFQGKTTSIEQIEPARRSGDSPQPREESNWVRSAGHDLADLTKPGQGTAGKHRQPPGHLAAGPGGHPQSRHRRRRAGFTGRDHGTGRASTGSSRRPAGKDWPGRRSPSGSRTDRMELVFDSALVEEEISGRRVLRLKKHQVLAAAGPPDHAAGDGDPLPPTCTIPTAHDADLSLVHGCAAPHRASRPCWSSTTRSRPSTNCGSRSTTRSCSTVFRIEGDR